MRVRNHRQRASALIVDDDALSLETFSRSFQMHLDMTVARTGAIALVELRKRCFDYALVDYQMPVMCGLQLLRIVALLRPKTVRILVTGHGDHPDVEAALRQGEISCVVSKPWYRTEILEKTSGEVARAASRLDRVLR